MSQMDVDTNAESARGAGTASQFAHTSGPDLSFEGRGGRVKTGDLQLDEALGGGFLPNTINVIMGQPGTGKTVLAQQMVFNNVGERKVLYLTTLSEPLSKNVRFLQDFEFFDQAVFNDRLIYEDIGRELIDRGPSAVVERMRGVIKEYRPKMIVIDSFKPVHDLADTLPELRRIVFEFAGLLSAYDTTTFLIGEYNSEHRTHAPEFTIADSIVELMLRPHPWYDSRSLRIHKLRGSGYRPGLHAFELSTAGLRVLPRLVTPNGQDVFRVQETKLPTGIPGLDPMLGGEGVWSGSATAVLGASGTGKTSAVLQFLAEGARRGERGLIVSLSEKPRQIHNRLADIAADLPEERRALIDVDYHPPVETPIDHLIDRIYRRVAETGACRVAIDSLTDLTHAAPDGVRIGDYAFSLMQFFAVEGVTAAVVLEARLAEYVEIVGLSARCVQMADNALLLNAVFNTRAARSLRVLKVRNSAFATEAREIDLRADGIHVGAALDDGGVRDEPALRAAAEGQP